jgi:RNA polymerase sigma factor (sigma-70 family)
MKNNSNDFRQMVYTASKSLRVSAMKFTHNSSDANDLIQDTLLKALSNSDKYRAGTNLKAWLYIIMKNTFISNYHKISKRENNIDLTENITMNNRLETSYNKGVSNICNKEIQIAIQELEDEFKIPFVMHFEGFKYKEIEIRLRIPMGTVKNRIHVARRKLMDKLKAYSDTKA